MPIKKHILLPKFRKKVLCRLLDSAADIGIQQEAGREKRAFGRFDPLERESASKTAAAARCRRLLNNKMLSLQDTFETCTWYRDHWTDGNCCITASAKGPFKMGKQ
jgi:hypothetical protein